MNAGKKKYGLSVNEKFGLVIIGIVYTTVLTSDRFLMFCENDNGVIRVKDLTMAYICSLTAVVQCCPQDDMGMKNATNRG